MKSVALPNELIKSREYERALEAYLQIPNEHLSSRDILNRASLQIRLSVDIDAAYLDLLKCLSDKTIAKYPILHNLGVYYEKIYQHDKAISYYSDALEVNSEGIDSLINRGNQFHLLGKHQEAIEDYKTASKINPKNPMLYFNTGNVYRNLGLYDESIFYYKKCLSIDNNYSAAKLNLANVYQMLGDSGAQEIILNQELEKPAIPYEYYHSYLFSVLHNEDHSPEYIFSEHKRVGKIIFDRVNREISLKQSTNPEPKTNKIRLGILSGDLRRHAVTKFFLPLFNSIDKNKFEIYVFCNHFVEDVFTQEYKSKADVFQKIYKKSDHEVAQLIFDNQLDILWDLSGHTGHSMNHLMALRLAKIQITGIGTPATSGIPNIDYYFLAASDKYANVLQDQFTEKLLCFGPNTEFMVEGDLPAITPKPCLNNGYMTIGIFSHARKYSKSSWEFWLSVLDRLPNCRVIFLGIASDKQREEVKIHLEKIKFPESRYLIVEKVEYKLFLNYLNKVDLLLDAIPYTAGTTAISAILMGTLIVGISGKSLPTLSGKMIYENFEISGNYPADIDSALRVISKLAKDPHKVSSLQYQIRNLAYQIIARNRKNIEKRLNDTLISLVDLHRPQTSSSDRSKEI